MILIDLDGVIVDIHTPLCEAHGLDIAKWVPGEYWFEKAFGVSSSDIFAHPKLKTYEFWANAPKTVFADEVMDLVLSVCEADNVCFLTKPQKDATSTAGKLAWIDKHYPKFHRLVGSSKKFCAAPGNTLLDDFDDNVNEFTAHGGRGILVPRVWNSMHKLSSVGLTMPYLREMLREKMAA